MAKFSYSELKKYEGIPLLEEIGIDITGINTDLNALENSLYAPSPQRPVPKEEKLEGIETILGIKKNKKLFFLYPASGFGVIG